MFRRLGGLQFDEEVVKLLSLQLGDPRTSFLVFPREAVGLHDERVDGGQVVLQGVEVSVAFFGGFEGFEVGLRDLEGNFEIVFVYCTMSDIAGRE